MGDWWTKRALIMLKFLLKIRQNDYTVYASIGNGTESTYAYDGQGERLQGRLLTANGDCIMETQKSSAIDSQFSTCRECMGWLPPGFFLRYNNVSPQTDGPEYQILSYFSLVLRTRARCLSSFYSTKIINSAQFIEILKFKTTSTSVSFFVILEYSFVEDFMRNVV